MRKDRSSLFLWVCAHEAFSFADITSHRTNARARSLVLSETPAGEAQRRWQGYLSLPSLSTRGWLQPSPVELFSRSHTHTLI